MVPERLKFLNEFDKFYQGLVRDVKEKKISERDFYMITEAKCKAEERGLRGRKEIKVEYTD